MSREDYARELAIPNTQLAGSQKAALSWHFCTQCPSGINHPVMLPAAKAFLLTCATHLSLSTLGNVIYRALSGGPCKEASPLKPPGTTQIAVYLFRTAQQIRKSPAIPSSISCRTLEQKRESLALSYTTIANSD